MCVRLPTRRLNITYAVVLVSVWGRFLGKSDFGVVIIIHSVLRIVQRLFESFLSLVFRPK